MQEVTINPSSFPLLWSLTAGVGHGSPRAARLQYALMIGISNEPLDTDITQINKMLVLLFNGTWQAARVSELHPVKIRTRLN